jgi:hypothetical protein
MIREFTLLRANVDREAYMTAGNLLTQFFVKHGGRIALSVPIGFLGGVVCGSMVLSLCGLAGRSGTTGTEYFGYWSFGIAFLGAMHGGPLGAILGPLGYLAVVREIGFRAAVIPADILT